MGIETSELTREFALARSAVGAKVVNAILREHGSQDGTLHTVPPGKLDAARAALRSVRSLVADAGPLARGKSAFATGTKGKLDEKAIWDRWNSAGRKTE